MKKITIKNDDRITVTEYIRRNAAYLAEGKALPLLKEKAIKVFEEAGQAIDMGADCTDYMAGTIQVQGEARHAIFKVTTKAGGTDWEAMAKALAEDAGVDVEALKPKFQKKAITSKSITWATEKQEEELQ